MSQRHSWYRPQRPGSRQGRRRLTESLYMYLRRRLAAKKAAQSTARSRSSVTIEHNGRTVLRSKVARTAALSLASLESCASVEDTGRKVGGSEGSLRAGVAKKAAQNISSPGSYAFIEEQMRQAHKVGGSDARIEDKGRQVGKGRANVEPVRVKTDKKAAQSLASSESNASVENKGIKVEGSDDSLRAKFDKTAVQNLPPAGSCAPIEDDGIPVGKVSGSEESLRAKVAKKALHSMAASSRSNTSIEDKPSPRRKVRSEGSLIAKLVTQIYQGQQRDRSDDEDPSATIPVELYEDRYMNRSEDDLRYKFATQIWQNSRLLHPHPGQWVHMLFQPIFDSYEERRYRWYCDNQAYVLLLHRPKPNLKPEINFAYEGNMGAKFPWNCSQGDWGRVLASGNDVQQPDENYIAQHSKENNILLQPQEKNTVLQPGEKNTMVQSQGKSSENHILSGVKNKVLQSPERKILVARRLLKNKARWSLKDLVLRANDLESDDNDTEENNVVLQPQVMNMVQPLQGNTLQKQSQYDDTEQQPDEEITGKIVLQHGDNTIVQQSEKKNIVGQQPQANAIVLQPEENKPTVTEADQSPHSPDKLCQYRNVTEIPSDDDDDDDNGDEENTNVFDYEKDFVYEDDDDDDDEEEEEVEEEESDRDDDIDEISRSFRDQRLLQSPAGDDSETAKDEKTGEEDAGNNGDDCEVASDDDNYADNCDDNEIDRNVDKDDDENANKGDDDNSDKDNGDNNDTSNPNHHNPSRGYLGLTEKERQLELLKIFFTPRPSCGDEEKELAKQGYFIRYDPQRKCYDYKYEGIQTKQDETESDDADEGDQNEEIIDEDEESVDEDEENVDDDEESVGDDEENVDDDEDSLDEDEESVDEDEESVDEDEEIVGEDEAIVIEHKDDKNEEIVDENKNDKTEMIPDESKGDKPEEIVYDDDQLDISVVHHYSDDKRVINYIEYIVPGQPQPKYDTASELLDRSSQLITIESELKSLTLVFNNPTPIPVCKLRVFWHTIAGAHLVRRCCCKLAGVERVKEEPDSMMERRWRKFLCLVLGDDVNMNSDPAKQLVGKPWALLADTMKRMCMAEENPMFCRCYALDFKGNNASSKPRDSGKAPELPGKPRGLSCRPLDQCGRPLDLSSTPPNLAGRSRNLSGRSLSTANENPYGRIDLGWILTQNSGRKYYEMVDIPGYQPPELQQEVEYTTNTPKDIWNRDLSELFPRLAECYRTYLAELLEPLKRKYLVWEEKLMSLGQDDEEDSDDEDSGDEEDDEDEDEDDAEEGGEEDRGEGIIMHDALCQLFAMLFWAGVTYFYYTNADGGMLEYFEFLRPQWVDPDATQQPLA